MQSRSGKALTITSLVLTGLNVLGLVIIGPVVSFMSSLFAGQFRHFDAQLPSLTLVFVNTPWWIWSGGGLVCALVLVVSEYFVADKRITTTLNVIVAVVVAVFLAVWLVAMILPLRALIDVVRG